MAKIFVYGERETMVNYANALEGVGLEALFSQDLSLAKSCDGLLLPGGGDIDPARYGQSPAGSETPDPQRDEAELSLVADFLSWGKPLLGICRGVQMLNVALGGTLIQDIPTALDHKRDPDQGDQVHLVTVPESSFLYPLYGGELAVNSAHHQALDVLGSGLRLAARSQKDGVIEAVEAPDKRAYGVQWHPERMSFALRRPDTVDGRPIFEFFRNLFL